jgi:hypothetical protein
MTTENTYVSITALPLATDTEFVESVNTFALSAATADLNLLQRDGATAVIDGAGADGGWLVCREVGAVAAAATAGLTGVVLIGCAAPSDDWGIVVAEARDLADAPRVMIPRGGGCWHDARS